MGGHYMNGGLTMGKICNRGPQGTHAAEPAAFSTGQHTRMYIHYDVVAYTSKVNDQCRRTL